MYIYIYIYNNNNNNFFNLQVANSPSKPGFKANLSKRIISRDVRNSKFRIEFRIEF